MVLGAVKNAMTSVFRFGASVFCNGELAGRLARIYEPIVALQVVATFAAVGRDRRPACRPDQAISLSA